MNKKFCILTLTHESSNRHIYLKETVEYFLKNTEYDEMLEWYIYINKTNEHFINVCDELIKLYKHRVDFKIIHSNVNNGVGYGINRLNEISLDYKFSLFLEGDWICIDSETGGQPKTWLKSSIKILEENKDVDAVFLRRYMNDYESRSTGIWAHYYTQNARVQQIDNLKYFIVPINAYTNNPLVRRNKLFFDKGIFPLSEFFTPEGVPTELKTDDITGDSWGQAEMNAYKYANKKSKYAMVLWGMFCHIDNMGDFDVSTRSFIADSLRQGCKKYEYGKSKCKFGYFSIAPHFCSICGTEVSQLNLEKMFERESLFLNKLDENRENWSHEQKISFVKQQNPNPECDVENFTKYFI